MTARRPLPMYLQTWYLLRAAGTLGVTAEFIQEATGSTSLQGARSLMMTDLKVVHGLDVRYENGRYYLYGNAPLIPKGKPEHWA